MSEKYQADIKFLQNKSNAKIAKLEAKNDELPEETINFRRLKSEAAARQLQNGNGNHCFYQN